jgi:hypothetical protein
VIPNCLGIEFVLLIYYEPEVGQPMPPPGTPYFVLERFFLLSRQRVGGHYKVPSHLTAPWVPTVPPLLSFALYRRRPAQLIRFGCRRRCHVQLPFCAESTFLTATRRDHEQGSKHMRPIQHHSCEKNRGEHYQKPSWRAGPHKPNN